MENSHVKLKPVSRSTLPDAIVEQIKSMIVKGNLKPGDRLPPERELSEMLNVGRTSVREALKALSSLGLIERSREGTFVKVDIKSLLSEPLNCHLAVMRSSIRELFEARRIFEVELAGLAARRATRDDIEAMTRALSQMDEEGRRDLNKFIEADVAFHLALAEAAQNAVLTELLQTVKALLTEAMETVVKGEPEIAVRSTRYHREILEAIRAQDPVAARELMSRHLDDVEEAIRKLQQRH